MILPATRGDGFHKVKAKPDVILPGGIAYDKSLNRWDGRLHVFPSISSTFLFIR